jgi:hypothetical protein
MMYYGELYEDKFNLWLCVFESAANHSVVCRAIERIPLDVGKSEDGTYIDLTSQLAENPEVWREWRHREQIPHMMFMRDICYRARKVGASADNFVGGDWNIDHEAISKKASLVLMSDDCADCSFGGLIAE